MRFTEDELVVGAGARLSRRRRLYLAVLLGMLAAFGPLCTDTYLPSLPAMGADLSLSTAATQLTITACLLGMALGQLFVGPLSDGTGRRGPLLCALVFFTLASACCVAARSGHGFIALRFAQGLGGAGGIVLSRAVACDLFRGPELTSFMSLLMAVNSVAPIAGPVLGGALAGLGGWPWVFIFLTGMGVALLLFCAFGLPETLPPKLRRQGGTRASRRPPPLSAATRPSCAMWACRALPWAASSAMWPPRPLFFRACTASRPRATALFSAATL